MGAKIYLMTVKLASSSIFALKLMALLPTFKTLYKESIMLLIGNQSSTLQ